MKEVLRFPEVVVPVTEREPKDAKVPANPTAVIVPVFEIAEDDRNGESMPVVIVVVPSTVELPIEMKPLFRLASPVMVDDPVRMAPFCRRARPVTVAAPATVELPVEMKPVFREARPFRSEVVLTTRAFVAVMPVVVVLPKTPLPMFAWFMFAMFVVDDPVTVLPKLAEFAFALVKVPKVAFRPVVVVVPLTD